MIDWTQPIETTETPPRPVRVLATDAYGEWPVVGMIDGLVHRFTADGRPNVYSFTIRNVAPPKPEPVLREVWLNCYPCGGVTAHTTEGFAHEAAYPDRETCRRVTWMSDGSPVPGEDDPVRYGVCETCVEKAVKRCDELVVERDNAVRDFSHAMKLVRSYAAKIDRLETEVGHLSSAGLIMEQKAEIARMRPVVDAAIVWERHFTKLAADRLVVAVRAYQSTPKKTAEEAVANVAAMMGPVKSCKTCRFHCNVAIESCTENGHRGWEAKND